MKNTLASSFIGFLCFFALADIRLHAQAVTPVGYANIQTIEAGDSDAVIVEKAAKVLPRANQSEWMGLERTFFLHFGVNTFNEVEWGTGREEASIFNPTDLNANQWLDAVTNFGGKMIVLVCKHHDGFCYWPTRYTPHSVAADREQRGRCSRFGKEVQDQLVDQRGLLQQEHV